MGIQSREQSRWKSRVLSGTGALGIIALLVGGLTAPAAFATEADTPTVDAPVESSSEVEVAAPEADAEASGEVASAPEAVPTPRLSPSAAGDETLSVTLAQLTGTMPFDADDAAGHDSSNTNDVVRTNDSVTYTVGVRFEGGNHTTPTISFTLPQGEELTQLPPFCIAGSNLSPATLPAPTVPVTASSWMTLPTQTVTCVVANQNQGTSLDYLFLSKVRSEVPNGTQMTPVIATATSVQVPEPAMSNEVSHSVSAAANFDVSKRRDSQTDNTGPFYQAYITCSFDVTRLCTRMNFPLTMEAPAGGKGITPLASPIVVTEDLRPDSFFGAGTTTSPEWLAAGAGALEMYAPRITLCNNTLNLWNEIPGIRLGTKENSVRVSGTITCAQPALGTPVDITFTDADTTGYTVPSTNLGGGPLPANAGYVISTAIQIEVPFDAVRDLGEEIDGVFNLNWVNNYSEVTSTAIDGTENQGEKLENNVRSGTTAFRGGAGAWNFDKGFVGVTGATGNTPTSRYTNWEYEGPAGSSSYHDGNTVVLPGQTVLSNLNVGYDIPPLTGDLNDRSFLACDVWDNTKLGMPDGFSYAGSPVTRVQFPSNGSPAWISSVLNDGFQPDTSSLQNVRIEYGYTATPGAGADSACDSGQWASTPAGVAGASVVDGTWRGVNRVRVAYGVTSGSTGSTSNVNVSIAMKVLESAGPNGTIIPNFASIQSAPGLTDLEGVIASHDREIRSSYNPETNSGDRGDRLTVGQATARIKKFVKDSRSGLFTDAAVPQYTSGALVEYRLNPTLTANVAANGLTQRVTVEDCLPQYQSYVSSARESGASITPVIVQSGAPTGAEVACGANETYIKWDLGILPINELIDPIVYSVEVSDTARNGTLTNTVVVASPGDPSSVLSRTDTAQIQIVVPTGIKISKTVDKPSVESNREGLENPRSFVWTIDFANIDSPAQVSDADVIDVLPANGHLGSAFEGSLDLDSVVVSAGSGVNVLYTKNAVASLVADPDDASNQPAGATTWCDAPSGGAVVRGSGTSADCPSSLSEVTGLRFLRAGSFEPTDEMTVKIAMTPQGNAAGDVYENRTSGRVVGVTQPVGPAIREVAVVASSIGDRVWEDLNSDGLQDDGEPGVAGFPVHLVGTDVDGNAVDLTTVTDENGAYLFENLASGQYRVIFDPSGLNSNTKFTLDHVGDDAAIDSDADPVTGQSQEFELGIDTQDLTLDAGLIVDRNVEIVLGKKFLGSTKLDAKNHTTVTYQLDVTNNGTAEGPYDLTDKLNYGGNIKIGEVTVENTTPGDIATNPDFDGQTDTNVVSQASIAGGATHTYLVTVEATVSTSITKVQSVCKVTVTEAGSGFLNEAELSMNGETVTDTACGDTPRPRPGSPLPVTGGDITGIAMAALLLLAAGASVLVTRRRRAHEVV